jgi:hypothetical protein
LLYKYTIYWFNLAKCLLLTLFFKRMVGTLHMRKQALTIGASIQFFYEALGRVFTAQKANKKIDTADSVLKRPNIKTLG